VVVKAFGFAKSARLLKAIEYKSTFKSGKKSPGRFFAIYVKPNTIGHPRLGLVVPKKAAKKAVHRNQIKRAARESFRLRKDLLGSHDIIFSAFPGIMTLEKNLFRDLLEQQWEKIRA